MKRRWIVILMFLVALGAPMGQAQQAGHHVVFAITSPDIADWMLTAGNIHNLKQGFAPDPVDIELVVYGPAVAMVKTGSAASPQIQSIRQDGAIIVACENSMRHAGISKADLVSGISTVPSGVVEVVKKQEGGWSYIKAGK